MNGWIDAPLAPTPFTIQVFAGPLRYGPAWTGQQIARHRPDWVALWGSLFSPDPGITRPDLQLEAQRTRWLLWRRSILQEGIAVSLLDSPEVDEPGAGLFQDVPGPLLHRWGHWTEWRSPARPFLPKVIFWDGARKAELEGWLEGLGWPALVVFRVGGSGPSGHHRRGRTLSVDLPTGMALVGWDPDLAGFQLEALVGGPE